MYTDLSPPPIHDNCDYDDDRVDNGGDFVNRWKGIIHLWTGTNSVLNVAHEEASTGPVHSHHMHDQTQTCQPTRSPRHLGQIGPPFP